MSSGLEKVRGSSGVGGGGGGGGVGNEITMGKFSSFPSQISWPKKLHAPHNEATGWALYQSGLESYHMEKNCPKKSFRAT